MMRDELVDRIAELEADNRRLRRLLDGRDAPGELRHRLRGTLSMLRTIIRHSADQAVDVEHYVAHLLDRLDAVSRAQAVADANGSVDLHSLIADQLLQYRISEDNGLRLQGPEIQLCARPAQILALAVHELAVNAIEHGTLGAEAGRLDVAWDFAPDGQNLVLTWKESGVAAIAAPSTQGFGTEVLTTMLAHDLKVDTSLDWEADGLRCVLVIPWSEKVGSRPSAKS
jgi:two-component sensor histidine kinase